MHGVGAPCVNQVNIFGCEVLSLFRVWSAVSKDSHHGIWAGCPQPSIESMEVQEFSTGKVTPMVCKVMLTVSFDSEEVVFSEFKPWGTQCLIVLWDFKQSFKKLLKIKGLEDGIILLHYAIFTPIQLVSCRDYCENSSGNCGANCLTALIWHRVTLTFLVLSNKTWEASV